MKFIVFVCVLAVATARPDHSYAKPDAHSFEVIEIIRDDRVHPEGGKYSFDVETEDGIKRSESGSPLEDVEGNPTGQQGEFSFTLPNGEEFYLKFVADEGGYQPESPFLPVAPDFPHPIPDFVLEQIAKAAREDAEDAKAPSRKYTYGDDDDDDDDDDDRK